MSRRPRANSLPAAIISIFSAFFMSFMILHILAIPVSEVGLRLISRPFFIVKPLMYQRYKKIITYLEVLGLMARQQSELET